MFDKYSERARMVVFVARLVAGKKGAAEIGLEHLVEGIVREDQGEISSLLGFPPDQVMTPPTHRLHRHFFPSGTASQILQKMGTPSTLAEIPQSADMPISPAVGEVFRDAMELCTGFQQTTVEPLHLLVAVLSDKLSGISLILREAGVTREDVLDAIREGCE